LKEVKIDEEMILLPDFLCNSGLALTFNYLLEHNPSLSEDIFSYIFQSIEKHLTKAHYTSKQYNTNKIVKASLLDCFIKYGVE
jgi:hypothetical protein